MTKKKNKAKQTSELDTKHKEELAEMATIAKRMSELSSNILKRVDDKHLSWKHERKNGNNWKSKWRRIIKK